MLLVTLGSPVVPFCPFFWVPLLKPSSRKRGTLIIKGLLGNLVTSNSERNNNNILSIIVIVACILLYSIPEGPIPIRPVWASLRN